MVSPIPYPIIDSREKELMEKLTQEYNRFAEPGLITKTTQSVQRGINHITPQKVKNIAQKSSQGLQNSIIKISEGEFIQNTLGHASKGYKGFNETLVKLTLSKTSILKDLKKVDPNLNSFEEICLLRSYNIEERVTKIELIPILSAFVNGGATGFVGLAGIPFNLVINYFLYFRIVQNIAMYYGYDVHGDPRELEFASDVVIECLSPSKDKGAKNLAGSIGKMTLQSELFALNKSLTKGLTFEKIASRGGIETTYVQVRSFGNKAAQKALDKVGIEQMEVGVFKKMMEQVGGILTKEVTKKAIPIISSIIGAFSDVYYMKRILKGANLIYHKRFLLEKEIRATPFNNIIDYPYEGKDFDKDMN